MCVLFDSIYVYMINDRQSQCSKRLETVRNMYSQINTSSCCPCYFTFYTEIRVQTWNLWRGDIMFISDVSVWTFCPFVSCFQQVESCFSGVRSPACPGSVTMQASKDFGPPGLFRWQVKRCVRERLDKSCFQAPQVSRKWNAQNF